jgi:hypothetical protein
MLSPKVPNSGKNEKMVNHYPGDTKEQRGKWKLM